MDSDEEAAQAMSKSGKRGGESFAQTVARDVLTAAREMDQKGETVVFKATHDYGYAPTSKTTISARRRTGTEAQYVVGDGYQEIEFADVDAAIDAFITDCAKDMRGIHQLQTTDVRGVHTHHLDVVAHQGKAHYPVLSLMPLKMPPYEDGAAGDKRRDTFCAKMKALLESPPRVTKKARTKK